MKHYLGRDNYFLEGLILRHDKKKPFWLLIWNYQTLNHWIALDDTLNQGLGFTLQINTHCTPSLLLVPAWCTSMILQYTGVSIEKMQEQSVFWVGLASCPKGAKRINDWAVPVLSVWTTWQFSGLANLGVANWLQSLDQMCPNSIHELSVWIR